MSSNTSVMDSIHHGHGTSHWRYTWTTKNTLWRGLTYSSRKSRGQPWLQNVSFITTCPFIITIQGGTLVNLQICEQKNMKTLVPKFGHKDYIQHSASPYYNSKRRPAHGNLYRVPCALGPSRGFNGSRLDLDFPSGGPDCALRPSSHTLTSTQSNQACSDGPPGGQSLVNCGCC